MRNFRSVILLGLLSALVALPVSPAQAAFGVEEFDILFEKADGTAEPQAGSHPFAITNDLSLTKTVDPVFGPIPAGAIKNVAVSLPPGLIGDPNATPRCSGGDFARIRNAPKLPSCANDTAVGTIVVGIYYRKSEGEQLQYFSTPVYNMEAPPGSVEKLGFVVAGIPVTILFTLSPKPPYNVVAQLHYISQVAPVFYSRLTLWGNPASPVHDAERGDCIEPLRSTETAPGRVETDGGLCPSDAPERAFLTVPRACKGSLTTSYSIGSWQEPQSQVFGTAETPGPPGFIGCEELGFGPTIDAQPTTESADSPSGLDFELNVENPGLTDPGQRADSDIKKTVVTLPAGITTNPSVAGGLSGCGQAEFESETLDSRPGTGCPESSKVGSVEVETPLLEGEVLSGSLYVAKPTDNEFHNLLTLDMVIKDPQRGVLIRVAGKVDPDPATGQLTTTFDDLPELPFSHFRLHFRKGQRAPLITPSACGRYTTEADLYSYANPSEPLHQEANFEITSGAGGGPCTSPPVRAGLSAGTISPLAGTFAPFVLKVQREDGTQQLSALTTKLPTGLTGRLAGVPYCSESGIAQAASRGGEGQGALETLQPSCPKTSEVGSITVGAGAGALPYYVTGHVYLAGPYKGAPLSLEIITPAIAGPFDLGAVAVRTALQVDPETAQITAVSDQIPSFLHGLPLDVRSISIDTDRPNFILNPTSCDPKQVTASIFSLLNQSAFLSEHFQASDCEGLDFEPELSFRLKGSTRRSKNPALKAVLTYPTKGRQANIAKVVTILPRSAFIDNRHINNPCTLVQFNARACPPKSILGRAIAYSPLLDEPLSGPVYFRSNGGARELPDLVASLDGQIHVELVGFIDSVAKKGSEISRLRTTFATVPDAPVSRFVLELKGGKRGLLQNSLNLCEVKNVARVTMVAQSGTRRNFGTPVANDCGQKDRKSKKDRRR